MLILRLVKTVIFLCLINSLYAQKSVKQELKVTPIETGKVEKAIFDITPDQMHAIQQIELEFEARERKKKLTDENFVVDQPKRAAEREEKIQNILSPEQWEKYQAFRDNVIRDEKRMEEERKEKSLEQKR